MGIIGGSGGDLGGTVRAGSKGLPRGSGLYHARLDHPVAARNQPSADANDTAPVALIGRASHATIRAIIAAGRRRIRGTQLPTAHVTPATAATPAHVPHVAGDSGSIVMNTTAGASEALARNRAIDRAPANASDAVSSFARHRWSAPVAHAAVRPPYHTVSG